MGSKWGRAFICYIFLCLSFFFSSLSLSVSCFLFCFFPFHFFNKYIHAYYVPHIDIYISDGKVRVTESWGAVEWVSQWIRSAFSLKTCYHLWGTGEEHRVWGTTLLAPWILLASGRNPYWPLYITRKLRAPRGWDNCSWSHGSISLHEHVSCFFPNRKNITTHK